MFNTNCLFEQSKGECKDQNLIQSSNPLTQDTIWESDKNTRNEKVNKQCLLDTPRTVRVSKKISKLISEICLCFHSCHFVKNIFWNQAPSYICSKCLYCEGKVFYCSIKRVDRS